MNPDASFDIIAATRAAGLAVDGAAQKQLLLAIFNEELERAWAEALHSTQGARISIDPKPRAC